MGANRDAELEGPWNRLRFAVQAPYADLIPRGGGGGGGRRPGRRRRSGSGRSGRS